MCVCVCVCVCVCAAPQSCAYPFRVFLIILVVAVYILGGRYRVGSVSKQAQFTIDEAMSQFVSLVLIDGESLQFFS